MISARQNLNILKEMFSGDTDNFTVPTSTFNATPNTYTLDSLPGSVVLNGNITPNNGIISNWVITAGSSSTPIASGTSNSVAHILIGAEIPSTIATQIYYLTVTYNNGTIVQSIVSTASVVVTAAALFGQLATVSDDINIPGDLTPSIESTLTLTNKANFINLFTVVTPAAARVLFVVPDSYGAVVDLQDNTNQSVLTQFNVVVDSANNRKIYVSINAVTPATYNYKFVF